MLEYLANVVTRCLAIHPRAIEEAHINHSDAVAEVVFKVLNLMKKYYEDPRSAKFLVNAATRRVRAHFVQMCWIVLILRLFGRASQFDLENALNYKHGNQEVSNALKALSSQSIGLIEKHPDYKRPAVYVLSKNASAELGMNYPNADT